jgi:hypothetical protein
VPEKEISSRDDSQKGESKLLQIDCRELTVDEQLALAASLSDSFSGRALALVKDETIVFDLFHAPDPQRQEVEAVVSTFISGRKDSKYFSTTWDGPTLIVHSADPLARSHGRKDRGQMLPPNLMKCPFSGCGFVTPYQELYAVHVRSHGF